MHQRHGNCLLSRVQISCSFLKLIFVIALILWPGISFAEDRWWGAKWSEQDVFLETTWQVIHVLDWGTTLDSVGKPDKYYEINPILGKYPTRGEVNAYMAAGAIFHFGMTHILPPSHRPYWQAITIGISSACVINNLSVGLKLGF